MERLHDPRVRRWLAGYVWSLKDAMGLRDWIVHVVSYPPVSDERECHAVIHPEDGKHEATVKFDADFLDEDPEEQRYIVCHELIHCHLNQVQWQVEDDLPTLLGLSAHQAFFSSFTRNVETAVDSMARAWAELLPLPPERSA